MLNHGITTTLLSLLYVRHSFSEMEGNIVGGVYSGIREFPHSAHVLMICKEKGKAVGCGSSIVNQRIILTAAHCFDNPQCFEKDKPNIIVRVGSKYRQKNGQSVTVKKIFSHKLFDPQTLINDIAIAMLSKSLRLNQSVKRVALMRNPPRVKIAYVAGWGRTKADDALTTSLKLKSTRQAILTNKECLKLLGQMNKGTICGMNKKKGVISHIARGDSGGALIVKDFIQIGIVSFRVPNKSVTLCVYTKVPNFIRWLRINIKRLYCS